MRAPNLSEVLMIRPNRAGAACIFLRMRARMQRRRRVMCSVAALVAAAIGVACIETESEPGTLFGDRPVDPGPDADLAPDAAGEASPDASRDPPVDAGGDT
jgi:hypothetical protein